MKQNPMQTYFELKEIDKTLKKIQQTVAKLELHNPELKEASISLTNARNDLINSIEEFELVFSID